jgi:hypothetical protein
MFMKNAMNTIKKSTFFIFVCSLLAINLGCGKEKSAATVYEWSATINGVNYSYSTPSYPSSDGGAVLFQTTNTGQGTSTSAVTLLDEGGFPQITVSSGSMPLSVGTFVFDASSSSTLSGFTIALSANPSNPQTYSSLVGNSQVTLNITSLGNVGGIVEGTFSGTVGKLSTTIIYINVSGSFKAYRER